MARGVGRSFAGASVTYVLSRQALAKLRLKAIRRGVWFRDLKDVERKLLDLTIAVVSRVRSVRLAKMVSPIVQRLLDAVESRISRLMRTQGQELAEKLSKIAQGWGHKSAARWPEDPALVRFVTVMNLHDFDVGTQSTIGSKGEFSSV